MTGKEAARANVVIEILRVENNKPPQILHRLSHSAHSLEAVFTSVEAVINSYRLPAGPNAFRIVTDSGTEIYRWPDRSRT